MREQNRQLLNALPAALAQALRTDSVRRVYDRHDRCSLEEYHPAEKFHCRPEEQSEIASRQEPELSIWTPIGDDERWDVLPFSIICFGTESCELQLDTDDAVFVELNSESSGAAEGEPHIHLAKSGKPLTSEVLLPNASVRLTDIRPFSEAEDFTPPANVSSKNFLTGGKISSASSPLKNFKTRKKLLRRTCCGIRLSTMMLLIFATPSWCQMIVLRKDEKAGKVRSSSTYKRWASHSVATLSQLPLVSGRRFSSQSVRKRINPATAGNLTED